MGSRFGGGWYYSWGLSPWWLSYWGFFRDVVGLELAGDLWDRTQKAESAASAGYWWPFRDFIMVCDNPTVIHMETVGGQPRMHCETGPAIQWSDGYGIHVWHGTTVPEWVITDPTPERAMRERNDEVRRAAIERIGWHEFTTGLTVLCEVEDPGNPGQSLVLFDLNNKAGRKLLGSDEWEEFPRLIVMHNASLDRGGHRRTYSRLVPGTVTDPVQGIAESYGISRDEYVLLEAAR